MHNALLIHEVLVRIMDYLAEDTVRHPTAIRPKDTRKSGRRALAVLARTCRGFSEPALDALWRRLHSLKPLVFCLTGGTASESGGPMWTNQVPIRRSFDDEEWGILLRYTPRVQELVLVNDNVSVHLLHSLCFRVVLLLPNLRKLCWTYEYEEYEGYEEYMPISSIRLLLSPSLTHLDVSLDGGDRSTVLGFLECYHTLCPNLKSLHFQVDNSSNFPLIADAVPRAICRSPNVEILTCDRIDEAALIHFSNSRRLTEFRANLRRLSSGSLKKIASSSTPEHPPFENLRILKLDIEGLSLITLYFKSQHQPLEEISFYFCSIPTPEVFHELFTALSSATRRHTLRRLRLQSTSRIEDGTSPGAISFQTLSPLTTFHLHSFEINACNPVSLNDDELNWLVQAWPELETFSVNQYYQWSDDQTSFQVATLRGLLLLLARCPKLRDLGLCIDARNVPLLTENESSICNKAITKLSVINSLTQEPVANVAHFLLEHLPSLTVLSAWTEVAPPFRSSLARDSMQMWKQVELQIRKIAGRDPRPDTSDSDSAETSDSDSE